MDMEQIVMKTEIQPNGDILLFYVDENNEVASTTILENNQQEDIQMLSETKYVIEDTGESESADELDLAQASQQLATEQWLDEEIRRLIVFYLDNKETFRSGTTKKKHLWAVACKTMLLGKQPLSCEYKLRSFREKYFQIHIEKLKGVNIQWQFYNICHQAFHDENPVDTYLNVPSVSNVPIVENKVKENIVPPVTKKPSADSKVEEMLQLYMQYKQHYLNHANQKAIWERIAKDMGEKDVDYWYKRFLNFKQHYIKMLYKRQETGDNRINWVYMKTFDEIFGNDDDFQKKFALKVQPAGCVDTNSWNDTEKTFLAKYCFDCLHEFQDPTIPDDFLWHEVGRLLAKKPEACMEKYQELKNNHFDKLAKGGYDLSSRIPLDIIFDNIIAKETEKELDKPLNQVEAFDSWETDKLDVLVNYIYDNIHLVKDPVCYYVCWATISKKLVCSISACRKQWDNLTSLYKTILADKKEDPEMQIDWRYIDMFDTIFDYGMDVNLLDGYENKNNQADSGKIAVKKIHIKDIDDTTKDNHSDDEVSYDERGFTLRSKRRSGEAKAYKILEYYLKNKDKFTSSHYKKLSLWETLAKQIDITATECAHRFRNFKQVYMNYIQREINKPEMPIVWPYYALCKKVFGYRAIKSKLKNGKGDSSDSEDWSPKEIKRLINYFSDNFSVLDKDIECKLKWTDLANEIGRTETSCYEKFVELRKSYRKLKTMKTNNPETKVSWKYFNMMDEIYSKNYTRIVEGMDIDEDQLYASIKSEVPDDDDFQCIIVIPEGQDISQAQFIYQKKDEQAEKISSQLKDAKLNVWNKRSKTRLLIQYLKYIKSHRNKEIHRKDMWTEIAERIEGKSPAACRKMFLKLKSRHKNPNSGTSPYYNLMEKILAIKPNLKLNKSNDLEEQKIYKDVPLDDEKVEKALNYYLQNLEDFVNPKFDKTYMWSELASVLSEPVNVVFNKINYLKQSCRDGQETLFNGTVEEILMKENELKDSLQDRDNASAEENLQETWTDLETERLLTWYLAHLDKFKNPKFVRSYLWMEASDILKKSPLVCSKKMFEIRSQYRTMVKENPEKLEEWRFYNLCQRIYGTGKKSINE